MFLCFDPCSYSSSTFFPFSPLLYFELLAVFPPSLFCIDISILLSPWPVSDPCFSNREVHLADVPCHPWVSWISIDVAHSFSPTLERGHFQEIRWPTGLLIQIVNGSCHSEQADRQMGCHGSQYVQDIVSLRWNTYFRAAAGVCYAFLINVISLSIICVFE